MSNAGRGIMISAMIAFGMVVYYYLWVRVPSAPDGGAAGTAAQSQSSVNYLNREPEIPQGGRMRVGSPALDFSYYTIDGKPIRLSDYVGQKPVVLDFWATWCAPCKAELPVLQEFYSANSADVEIIAISSEERGAASTIARLVQSMGLTFPVVHDPSRKIANMYPTSGIPYLVFIDRNGTVVKEVMGMNPNIGEEIKEVFGL